MFTIFILYIAQGVPIGLFWFAIPAWMAANGADTGDIAWVIGLTSLPWSLQIISAFLMDRYSFLPMGRRRGWILGAQSTMVLIFLAAAIIHPEPDDVLLLGLFGFFGNLATTFQDVGVDGMAVDLLKERERAKGGGMMFGGQLLGTAAATAGSGWAVVNLGASGAYLLGAAGTLVVCLYLVSIRERNGERHFPWSPGEAHDINLARYAGAWKPILDTTLRSVILPVSLFWVAIMLIKGIQYGVMTGVTPLVGVGEAGFSEAEVTRLIGLAQLIAGVAGMTAGAWLGDHLGAKRSALLIFSAWALFHCSMFAGGRFWDEQPFVEAMIIGWFVLDTMLMVVIVPITMRLCHVQVAATQFTIYMTIMSVGVSLGPVMLGLSGPLGGLVYLFPILLCMNLVGMLIMMLVRFPRRQFNFNRPIRADLSNDKTSSSTLEFGE